MSIPAASLATQQTACDSADCFESSAPLTSCSALRAGQAAFVSKGWDETQGETISLTIDSYSSHACNAVNIVCCDRKGLLYDLLRTTHQLGLLVEFATIDVRCSSQAEVQLFLKDSFGNAVSDQQLLTVLLHKLRKAVQLPLCVAVRCNTPLCLVL